MGKTAMITLKLTEAEYHSVKVALAEAVDIHDTDDNLHYYTILKKVRTAEDKPKARPRGKPYKLTAQPTIHEAYESSIAEHVCTQAKATGKSSTPVSLDDPISPHIGYICSDCAKRLGAVWPEGHCATCHGGVCPECKEHKGLCSVDDWNWPKVSKRPKHGAGRD